LGDYWGGALISGSAGRKWAAPGALPLYSKKNPHSISKVKKVPLPSSSSSSSSK
jgi:hypothetical protein